MKGKTLVLTFVLLVAGITASGQEKSKKELRAEKKLEARKQVEALVNSKQFKFVGRTALPTGMKSVNLSSNPNFMKFSPEMVESEMPFFGRAYSATGYGTDTGVRFKGKPEKFDILKKEKTWEVEAEVKGTSDSFRISLSVGAEGGASLTITSNARSTITYQGDIFPLD